MKVKALEVFCKENHIAMELERKTHEKVLRFLYNKRNQEYQKVLSDLKNQYEKLEEKVEKVQKYNIKIMEEIPEFEDYFPKGLEVKMPEVDFSDFELASAQIKKELECYETEFWEKMAERLEGFLTNERERQEREMFLFKKAKELPEGKNVLIIKNAEYVPCEEYERKFQKEVEALSKKPSKGVTAIDCFGLSREWFAFCPKLTLEDQIRTLAVEWIGSPENAKVSYV